MGGPATAMNAWISDFLPEYLSSGALAELHTSSCLQREVQACRYRGHALELDVFLPEHAVATISLQFSEHTCG